MKILRDYLWYRLKQSALFTAIFTVLSVLLTQTWIGDCIRYTEPDQMRFNSCGLEFLAIILGIAATVIPFLEMRGFKNRRNLDTLYFFPIKRGKMALVHYLSGLIQMTFIYTVTYAAAAILLVNRANYFALVNLVPYFFLSLLIGILLYSLFIFLFTQGNTVLDGVVFSIMWMFAGYLVLSAVANNIRVLGDQYILAGKHLDADASWAIIYAPLNNLTVLFRNLIEINQDMGAYYTASNADILAHWYWFLIWGVLGVAATVGFFATFIKRGAQKAGEISDSWFGYRLLIPVYGYSLLLSGGRDMITVMMVLAAMIIGYFIYRRSFKLKLSDIIVTAAGIIPVALSVGYFNIGDYFLGI